MADRKDVNSDFVWYVDDDRVAILYKNDSSGKYEPWDGSNVEDGLRISYTSKYDAAKFWEDNFKDNLRVDSGLHAEK